MDSQLEETIKATSAKEYAKVFATVEASAYVGSNIGIYTASAFTKSNLFIAAGTLTGDFVGGTIGQIAIYWYNNQDKFRDETGFLYKRFAKDVAKFMVYDAPISVIAYAATSQVTYNMLERDWDKNGIAAITALTMMTIWNSLNYFVYSVVKFDSDEKLWHRIKKKIRKNKAEDKCT